MSVFKYVSTVKKSEKYCAAQTKHRKKAARNTSDAGELQTIHHCVCCAAANL